VTSLPPVVRVGWLLVWIAGCGSSTPGGQASTTPPNTLPVTVDQGPAELTSSGMESANAGYASITVCSPGSTTGCQTLDHLLVDTGSTGLRIVHEVLSPSVVPQPLIDPASGRALSECMVFADGWSWGSLVTADVTIGGRTISGLVLEVMGDPASGTAPTGCTKGNGPEEDSVQTFRANGVLGVGYFLQDCGSYCEDQVPTGGAAPFYACTSSGGDEGCTPTTVSVRHQPSNAVAMLSGDNNGLILRFPSTGDSPAASLTGTLLFGIATQANNGLGPATFHSVDPTDGTLSTTYGGQEFPRSVIDSGSNALFFTDAAIPVCPSSDVGNGFYCPPSPIDAAAVLDGSQVSFTVGNADQLFTTAPTATVYPTLSGPLGNLQLSSSAFDWGLPFFFGRSVFLLFETRSAGSTMGPAIGF
jgi:Protein of unknown function (DUF3443)